ncbi:XRE family transcriptional regulator [Flavobacterium sp.]|uniref:XRE family transcriptional regulator n=1 Tax=Flavobacterium sp. TaxID=239 RepID=UPI002488BFEB|nr:XRE family transcriptional regulator [Flavobacterium sp.]MDI1317401.1 XRE family transcriptional regulator [Flavobacterium sp.]
MSLFSDNIKILRNKKSVTQQVVAEGCRVPRDRYVKYEGGINLPPPDFLLAVSRYFHISIDILLSVDLRKIPVDDLLQLGDNRILLPIVVDQNGNNFIEIIPHKARAGYLTGYSDPEFIENLQQVALPFLGAGKMRAFPIGGDSMPPHTDKSFVVGRYVENLGEIKKDKTYIIITLSEGITYKRLNSKNVDSITVEPDNIIYSPYDIRLSDILEIWEYVAHIGQDDTKISAENASMDTLILEMSRDIKQLKNRLV